MTDANILLNDDLSEEDAGPQKSNELNLLDDLELDNENEIENESQDEDAEAENETVTISKSKIVLIKKLLDNIDESRNNIKRLLSGVVDEGEEARISIGQMSDMLKVSDSGEDEITRENGGRIIEGVFDGENMIGPDGKQYSVPANYASKSKLIEGDIMKLTITGNGTFVYKQIGPIERIRVVGELEQGESGNFTVVSDDKKWKVLTASVTYYKGQPGDEVVILVPKTGESKWAAVENIVRNKG
jgi:hypothetical protein